MKEPIATWTNLSFLVLGVLAILFAQAWWVGASAIYLAFASHRFHREGSIKNTYAHRFDEAGIYGLSLSTFCYILNNNPTAVLVSSIIASLIMTHVDDPIIKSEILVPIISFISIVAIYFQQGLEEMLLSLSVALLAALFLILEVFILKRKSDLVHGLWHISASLAIGTGIF